MIERPNQPKVRSWITIAALVAVGSVQLALAFASATIYRDQTERHDDGLLLVVQAAIGGIVLGIGLAGVKRRFSGQN